MLQLHPAISDAAVVGVADEKWGEVPVAVVIAGPGQSVDETSLFEHLGRNLGRYKHPKRILIAEELPRTGLDKPDYPAITEMVAGMV